MNEQADWLNINEQHLNAAVLWICLRLKELACPTEACCESQAPQQSSWFNWFPRNKSLCSPESCKTVDLARQEMTILEEKTPPPALNILAEALGLSGFDQCILLLCVAMELDPQVATLCAKAQGNPHKTYPTFALACRLFDNPVWDSLTPNGPLRYWRLLEIHPHNGQPITGAALAADERVVNFLKGINQLDDRLAALLDPLEGQANHGELPPSQQENIDSIIQALLAASNCSERPPIIELLGHDTTSKELIASQSAGALGRCLYLADLKILPAESKDFATFARLWQRESRLLPLALFIRLDGSAEAEQAHIQRFLAWNEGLIFLDLEENKTTTRRNRFSVEISKPTPEEQEQLWLEVLPVEGDLPQRLAEQFSFGAAEIKRLAQRALEPSGKQENSANELWQACRLAARSGMEQLAQRIEVKATWERLVLPKEQKDLLGQIIDQVPQRNQVYDDWGFRGQMNRGLGINALFTGESGTGKTMAAEVIAQRLELDLYRIDLSSVVSKYIGETEKNLRKLFDTAEDSGAILFFDEADALFGKRSEVKDSHDRYANIEINYLLQRIETYRGLAILASNVRTALDKAFTRRLRFIVEFPFPGKEQRREIWCKVFPAATPVQNLDYDRLKQLNLTGGNIHNVAMNAAFLAAKHNCPVSMGMLLVAAQTEYKKLNKSIREGDFKWEEQKAECKQQNTSLDWQQYTQCIPCAIQEEEQGACQDIHEDTKQE